MGDRQLQREVLNLLAEQAQSVRLRVGSASPEDRAAMAHGLKGAARGVGAFVLADCADALEREPEIEQHRTRLEQAADAFLAFLSGLEQEP
ncbi:histidine kinase [Aquamicrobium ahrensii]|uniref:HPt (Histidine-containing phosphotransfer) domain-containing protein n=1 Tax=Aquamicrobium ahrensii TaxID=469551 RepID=A0ABV2KGF9_9HYPH